MTRPITQPGKPSALNAPQVWIGRGVHGEHHPYRTGISGTAEKGATGNKPIAMGSVHSHPGLSERPRRLRVLIVEDEAIVAMDLEMLLEELEAEVIGIAMSAAEADVLVAVEQPDVVTMDVNIKGDRDGVNAAQGIFDKHGIRSIFISAYSELAMRQRAEPCDAIGWIEKPVHKAALADALDRVKRNAD